MWIDYKGYDRHAHLFSDSARRSLPAALYIFAAIFQSMPLLLYCLSTWPHVCV